jgi:phage regulator Rha-like protein
MLELSLPGMNKALKAYSDEFVMSRIHVVRGQKVMLDRDLAQLFEVETRALNLAVKRNAKRFPEDFMFKLTREEAEASRSQTVILKRGSNIKYAPSAFTEHGVLMLSNVLRSERAVLMSIQIIRVFTRMREMLVTHKDLLLQLEKLRHTSKEHTGKIAVIFKYLKQMEQRQQETELLEEIRRRKAKNPIGFKAAKDRRGKK